MAINDKEFYASHGFDFDYQNMLDKYIKGVKNQAKIEVLAEIQQEIEEKATEIRDDGWWLSYNCLIQKKIDKLKEGGI